MVVMSFMRDVADQEDAFEIEEGVDNFNRKSLLNPYPLMQRDAEWHENHLHASHEDHI